ncbi:MAG: TonB family protein [Elusimicrobia bacterium]|nr:TonB family protein [Elusimicrobiota bacterium]
MTDIKLGFIISISVHFLFFLVLSRVSKPSSKIYYIPIQVIGSGYGNVGSGGLSGTGGESGTTAGSGISTEKISETKKAGDVVKPGDIVTGKVVSKKSKLDKKDVLRWEKETGKGTGLGSGTGVGEGFGTGIGVDAGNFPYMGYVNILRNKVAQNWNPEPYPSSSPKKVLVYFKILKDGKVDNLTVKESAGVSFIDRAAIRAITNSAPFPPLPAGYSDDYLGVYFMFELSGS